MYLVYKEYYIQEIEYNMMDINHNKELSDLFKAMNHPVRLAILDVLRLDEACVCHLEAVLGQRQAYISQQLSVLRDQGIIRDRRDGWNVFYQVADQKIFEIMDAARKLVFGDTPPEIIIDTENCSCPKCTAKKAGLKQENIINLKIST